MAICGCMKCAHNDEEQRHHVSHLLRSSDATVLAVRFLGYRVRCYTKLAAFFRTTETRNAPVRTF